MSGSMAETALKEIHDNLMAERPEGADHPEDCPICAMEEGGDIAPETTPEGGTMGADDKLYTAEEVKAALAEATKDVRAELDAVLAERAASEGEQALAELRETFETEKSALQAKLDEAVLAAETEKDARERVEAWLKGEAEAAEEQAAIAARRDDRLKKALDAAEFPEGFKKHIEENADRLAAMSDEEFDSRIAEWAALAEGKTPGDDELPGETALRASRDGRETTTRKSAVKELRELRQSGVDVRTL